MSVTAETVRQLRERTGAGMLECKKALVETKGDLDAAAELMRKQGLAKADKKATRVAAEGVIAIARSSDAQAVAECALTSRPADLAALAQATLASGESVDERRRNLIAKIGENISVRRF